VRDAAVVVVEAVAMAEAVAEAVTVEVVAEEADPEVHQEADNEIEHLVATWVKQMTTSADNFWTSFCLSMVKPVRDHFQISYKFLHLIFLRSYPI